MCFLIFMCVLRSMNQFVSQAKNNHYTSCIKMEGNAFFKFDSVTEVCMKSMCLIIMNIEMLN